MLIDTDCLWHMWTRQGRNKECYGLDAVTYLHYPDIISKRVRAKLEDKVLDKVMIDTWLFQRGVQEWSQPRWREMCL